LHLQEQVIVDWLNIQTVSVQQLLQTKTKMWQAKSIQDPTKAEKGRQVQQNKPENKKYDFNMIDTCGNQIFWCFQGRM